MTHQIIDGIPVFGDAETLCPKTLNQIKNCARTAEHCALMADNHLGYAVPIGGVVAYKDAISPSGVGYDIGCGNKAVCLDMCALDLVAFGIDRLMDQIVATISFGMGQKNDEKVDHELFDDPAWSIASAKVLKDTARNQLGTVGGGNHYVDVFYDEELRVWIGCHFGSRGLGHKLATHYVKAGGGRDGIDVDPVVLDVNSELGAEYVACMSLAGRYAYAGRDWVCSRVAKMLGANIIDEVHNHHNFAWLEEHDGEHLWVVRKGATPAFPGQRGFVGSSMAEPSVILEGVEHEESKLTLYSTVHGAGRVMSRTEARGRFVRDADGKKQRQPGRIRHDEWMAQMAAAEVTLRGAGLDEAPGCYKRLDAVLAAHSNTVRILHTLTPVGVAMAGENEVDPYKD